MMEENKSTSVFNDLLTSKSDSYHLSASHLSKVKSALAGKIPLYVERTVCCDKSLQSDVFWDICSELCLCLTEKTFNNDGDFFESCQKCFEYLLKNGNNKELFLVLAEHIRIVQDDVAYVTLAQSLCSSLSMMTSKLLNLSCDVALQSALQYLKSLELPKPNLNLEGDERKLVAFDPLVRKYSENLQVYLDIVNVFTSLSSLTNETKDYILDILLDVIGTQLIFTHIVYQPDHSIQESSGHCINCTVNLLSCIAHLYPDFYKLLSKLMQRCKLKTSDVSDQSDFVLDASIGCFIYFILGEQILLNSWPSILKHTHVFQLALPFIIVLLKRTEDLVIYKGIFLLESLILSIGHEELESNLLDDNVFSYNLDALANIMLHCNVLEYRQRSLKLFTDYISRFSREGRHKLYAHIVNKISNTKLIGYTVGLIKQEIHRDLSQRSLPDRTFVGNQLEKLLIPALSLADGVTTDLLVEGDRVIAGLNLIRYLLIRDPIGQDLTGVWQRISTIESRFLEPLKNGINHSRSHYNYELKMCNGLKSHYQPSIEVNIGDTIVPPNLQDKRKEIIEDGLRLFDLIDSLHGRVSELISVHKRKSSVNS